jgi:citrate synthase
LIRSTVDERLTTPEAAHRLGVKTATLYAYVSRGLLHAERVPGGRGSLFVAAEVDALAGRGRSGRRPAGAVETVRSALTSLDGDRLRYRGVDAVELSRTHTFEAVARLLWTGAATRGPFARDDGLTDAVRAVVQALPVGLPPTARLRVAVAATGALADPGTGPEPLLGAVLGALTDAPAEGVAATLGAVLGTDAGLDPYLVLLADHGLAVSTVAARVAASARAPLASVLGAALGAAAGPLHASASAQAARVLAGGPLPTDRPAGFGHLVYASRDPRADELLSLLPDTGAVDHLVERVVRAHGATAFPNVDLALAAFTHAHGLPAETGELVFEVARTAGWIAHALEEYAAPPLRYRVRGLHGA